MFEKLNIIRELIESPYNERLKELSRDFARFLTSFNYSFLVKDLSHWSNEGFVSPGEQLFGSYRQIDLIQFLQSKKIKIDNNLDYSFSISIHEYFLSEVLLKTINDNIRIHSIDGKATWAIVKEEKQLTITVENIFNGSNYRASNKIGIRDIKEIAYQYNFSVDFNKVDKKGDKFILTLIFYSND